MSRPSIGSLMPSAIKKCRGPLRTHTKPLRARNGTRDGLARHCMTGLHIPHIATHHKTIAISLLTTASVHCLAFALSTSLIFIE